MLLRVENITVSDEEMDEQYELISQKYGQPVDVVKQVLPKAQLKPCLLYTSHQSAYKCSLCSECTLHCSDFVEDVCSVKNKPPYVCLLYTSRCV